MKPRVLLISLILFAIISLSTFLRYSTTVTGQTFQLHPPIVIVGNGDFTRANGVSGGDGSFLNPFIIRGWNISAPGGVAINITGTTDYFVVEEVLISSSQYGIVLDKTANGQVSNSTLSNNQNGILILSSNETLVYNNNFVANTDQAKDTQGIYNSWDNGYKDGGNYWSDYSGVDHCSGYVPQTICPAPDGIGDTYYTISGDSGAVDDYPLMKPFLPDTTPPVWPQNKQLMDSMVTPNSLTLQWTNATVDTGVTLYRVYEGSSIIANVTANRNSYNVTGLQPSTSYTFKVEAGDHSNNWSTDGPTLTARTSAVSFWLLSTDFWIRNWYLALVPLAAIVALTFVALRQRRRSKTRVSPIVDAPVVKLSWVYLWRNPVRNVINRNAPITIAKPTGTNTTRLSGKSHDAKFFE